MQRVFSAVKKSDHFIINGVYVCTGRFRHDDTQLYRRRVSDSASVIEKRSDRLLASDLLANAFWVNKREISPRFRNFAGNQPFVSQLLLTVRRVLSFRV